MKKLSLLLFLLTASSIAQTEQIENHMKLAHERNNFNGNVLVTTHGKLLYEDSLGSIDASGEKKLTPQLRIEIGSISKEFNAVGIMILKEEGKLDTDDKISKYFPELPKWAEKVSIKNLMQYTAGFPDVELEEPITDEKAWKFLKNLSQLEFEPGSSYNYTNYNIFLQRRIIERITGTSYAEFLKKRIFTPLGMNTALVDPHPETPMLAKAFDLKMTQDEPLQYMSGLIYLTPQDLHKWVEALHNDRLISRKSFLFLSERFKNKQSSLGTVVFKDKQMQFHYHHGSSHNYESSFIYVPKLDATIILMTNSKRMNNANITNAIIAILEGEKPAAPKKSIYLFLRTEIMYEGIEKGLEYFKRISQNEREMYNFDEEKDELLDVGNYLVDKDRIEDAVAILELSTKRHSNSPEVFLALGKAYESIGETELAIAKYQRSIELSQDSPEAKASLRSLQNQIK